MNNVLGFDIVNLDEARYQNKHLNQRWLDKVFTFQEQEQILLSHDSHQHLWMLWACKESFFKAYSQYSGRDIRNFKKIELPRLLFTHIPQKEVVKVVDNKIPVTFCCGVNKRSILCSSCIIGSQPLDSVIFQKIFQYEGSRSQSSLFIRKKLASFKHSLSSNQMIVGESFSYDPGFASFAVLKQLASTHNPLDS